MMKYKKTIYQGQLPIMPSTKILLNVNHLKPGDYALSITLDQKVIKTVNFTVTDETRVKKK